MRKRETKLITPTRGTDDTFSPVREKVSKERTFVCAELTPYKSENETVSKVSIGTHYSGGIIALSAKMWVIEYLRLSCALLNMAEIAQEGSVFLIGDFIRSIL